MKSSHNHHLTTSSSAVNTSPFNTEIVKKQWSKLTVITAISALALTGCQSNSAFNTGGVQPSALTSLMASQPTTEQQSTLAKNTLVAAMQKQRTSAYRYRMDMIGSNQSRLAAFEQASDLQLSMSDVSEEHCEHLHDEAYVSLLERVQLEGADIEDAKYSTQRRALKSAFVDCKTEQVAWENSRYQSIELEGNDTDHEEDASDYEAVGDSNQQLLDELISSMIGDTSQGKFLPNYDSAHTKLDARKARLLDAYLLKPTSISSQGVYQPLLSKMSITPTLRYQAPNLTSIANHYIFLNAKEGAIYIWADTYAYLLSVYFDEQLGTSMHNKWLKLELNDGSLPAGFGKDLISSHFAAKDKALQQIPSQRYKILTNNQLLATAPKIDAKFLPYLQSAPYVIERRLTEEDIETKLHTYFGTLYQQITDKYPDLVSSSQQDHWDMLLGDSESTEETTRENASVEENTAAEDIPGVVYPSEEQKAWAIAEAAANDTAKSIDRESVGGEDLNGEGIELEGSDVASVSDEELEEEAQDRYSSRQLITTLLSVIENNLKTDVSQIGLTETDSQAVAEKVDTVSSDKTNAAGAPLNNPAVNYTLYDPNTAENQWLWRDVYAIDTGKRIQWHFTQYKLAEDTPADEEVDILRGLELQSLTRYEPVTIAASVFNSLPEGTTVPNADNTIDLRQYTQDLLKRYDEGGGAPLGRKIVEGIKIGQIPLPSQ